MTSTTQKLPLWRLIAGIAELAALITVLLALAPVYVRNYQLTQAVRALANDSRAAAESDDALRADIIDRARRLDLPVRTDQVKIAHPAGKLRLEMNYVVQESLAVYQVDLHFHPDVVSR